MSKILCKRIIMLTLLGCMAQSLQAVTLTVTNLSDSGSGSLRAILAKAHDGDTIVFARSLKNNGIDPLVLSSPISINKNITIQGDVNGDKNTDITISGGGHTRLFKIESGSKVTLKFLNLIRGYMYFATGTISRMGETSTGGGIYNYGTLTMEYCRMSHHYTSHGGGAILNNGGTLNIRGSTFSDNNGGAIYNGGGGKVYIRQSTFKNNVNDFGGAIDSFRSTLELSDSTLVSNRANNGSAIFSDGTTVIRNSTFYGNITPADGHKINASTVYGDHFTHNATLRLENTVIAGSTGKNCSGFGTYTIDHSWFDDDSCPNGVASGTGTNSGNPELGSLQDNGGYTETMMPSGKSGLINAGNPQTCTVRDQRSAQRVGTCDIGAVEYGGSVPRTLTVTNDESLGPGSLRAILTEANDGDTIVFDPSLKNHTIFMLGSGHYPRHITLDKSVVINGDVDGDRKPDIILSGTGNHNMHTRLLNVNQGKTVTLEGLRLVHGFADYGGAIWNHGTLTINYCRLSYNTAKAGDGVSGAGGAIYNDASGTLIINNTTLDHNTAMSAGGAIQNFKGKVMLMNVTLSDNAGDPSNEDVGAALNNMEGRMTLKNTTLYRTTGNGIGIYGSNGFGSDTTLVNTVIAGSSENNCAGHGAYHLFGTNWFDDNTCGSSSSGDPKLGGPLSTDSGWALNMPASNSGLIDAGDDDTCLHLDARGYRRPHGDHCDIGAVEVGATAPPDTDGDVDEVIDTSFRLNDTGIIRLNDTGITRGGDYVEGNNATCTSNITAPQDCHQGRDATHNDDSDGHAGFSFTKLDANGNQLPPGATSWSCVMDNVTGLIWEAKTDDGGIHDKDNTYRWGGKTAQGSGFGTYYNDWDSLVDGSNAEQLCGYDDWRVSSVDELLSLVNNDRTFPAIDTDYFPNTAIPYFFWSSSPYADDSDFAWYAYFSSGGANKSQRNHDLSVWLVHSRQ